jgi:thymidylate synthase (FAD)
MPKSVSVEVQLIAWSHFEPPADIDWHTDADGGQALAEFAGRACYQSWAKTIPATSTNAGYLEHILQVGHLSVLEHGSATCYLTGLSSSVAHELLRHRQFSFSQLSPRQNASTSAVVEPPEIATDPELHALFSAAMDTAAQAYQTLLTELYARLPNADQATLRSKQARQAARAVLPAATETKLVMTGNFRAWRQLIGTRAAEHADPELRSVVIGCLRKLTGLAPNVFADFTVHSLADGTEVASSPFVAEG